MNANNTLADSSVNEMQEEQSEWILPATDKTWEIAKRVLGERSDLSIQRGNSEQQSLAPQN